MKKLFKILFIFMTAFILCGCEKNISKLSYTTYNEYFSNKVGYIIMDNTSRYDLDVKRYLEAGDGNIQIFYIEFDSEKSANKYLEDYYSSKEYKIKKYDTYTYIKSSKNGYLKLYKTENLIVMGTSIEKKYKRNVNRVLKDLGY